jgi:hypothetical protein
MRTAVLSHEEQYRWKVAKAIREARPSWVVIWVPQLAQFRGHPKFRVRSGDAVAGGQDRAELEAEMDQIEERSRPGGRADSEGR